MNRSNLVIDVEAILAEAKPPITDDCCIYRVPHDIREVNADAYTPKFISIGPLHHKDQRLKNMEKFKQVYFKQFVSRAKTTLEDLISCVEEDEPRLRRCYSENLGISTSELVKVILLDACFIVELFWKSYRDEWTEDDFTLRKPKLFTSISFDLLLLENQVPFFILENLYNLAFASHKDHRISPSFLALSIDFFKKQIGQNLVANFETRHFTDLLRTFHLQQQMPERKDSYYKHIRSASEFCEAGVKFSIIKKPKCILDFQLSGRCLEIPHIVVDDNPEIVFRNMVALEQCHYPYAGYVTDDLSVMDFLINTGNDVGVLVKNDIFLHWLGDNDSVAKLFNSLLENVVESNFNSEYIRIFKELDNYCNRWWPKMRATLKRDYFNTPWRGIATGAAIAILVFTFIQTLCSFIQVR